MRALLSVLASLSLSLSAQEVPWPDLEPVTWDQVRQDPMAPDLKQESLLVDPDARRALQAAIDASLNYLASPAAGRAYAERGGPEAQAWVRRSLEALRDLIEKKGSPDAFAAALQSTFQPYRMKGQDGVGTMHITGYFEGFAEASRTRTGAYRYPLYRKPKNLAQWPQPHPTRLELEGRDGLQGSKGPLKGLELVWLKDRFEAYLIHVQGSARLRLPDGKEMTVGYAGRTEHPYVSVGQELDKDLKTQGRQTLNGVFDYLRNQPGAMDAYLPRNPRFIFFAETKGAPPKGSLGIPLTGHRSLATDKLRVPPGAALLLHTEIPTATPAGPYERRWTTRLALDQDSGGAILGPGRIDVFCGGGPEGRAIAGGINGPGRAYVLLLPREGH